MEAQKKRNIPKNLLLCLLFGGVLVMCLEMGLSMLRPEVPGSLARHGVLWAVCFGLLAAGTLLAACWRPAAEAWRWAEEKLMDPETRKPWIDITLAAAAGGMLLHHFYVLLYYPVLPAGATKLAPVWIVLAAATAVLARSWRDRGTRIGTLLLVYTFERTYLEHLMLTGNETVYFADAVYAVFICYNILSALRPRARKLFLGILCALWSLGTCGLCGTGLYTAWTGNEVHNFTGGAIRVHDYRLELFSNPDITGGWAACCFAVALTGFVLYRKKAFKGAFALTAFAAALTVSLADSRSAMIMVALMLAGMLCLSVWDARLNKAAARLKKNKAVTAAAILVICFVLCFALILAVETRLASAFVNVRTRGSMRIRSVLAEQLPADAEQLPAEEEEVPEAAPQLPNFIERDSLFSRRTESERAFSGRLTIWQDALCTMMADPGKILMGYSVDGAASAAVGRTDHLHNILIQILMEGGIPALLLFLGLLLYFFVHACRLWKQPELPLWQRLLPVPALAILMQEMAECLTHFAYGHPPMTVFWFFMGCTVAVSRQVLAEETGRAAGVSLPRGATGG